MPPTGGTTGRKNIELKGQLWFWNRQNKLGIVFNSSTAFHLPDGADRSPDAAWVYSREMGKFNPRTARLLSSSKSRFCHRIALKNR